MLVQCQEVKPARKEAEKEVDLRSKAAANKGLANTKVLLSRQTFEVEVEQELKEKA